MTKLSVARVFEVSQIAATKAYGEIQTFVEYVNSLADNLIRILQNGIGIRDNLDAEIKTVTLTHGSPTSVAFCKRPITIQLSAMSGTQLNPVVALHAATGEASQATLTAYFLDPTNKDGVLHFPKAVGQAFKADVTVTAYFS